MINKYEFLNDREKARDFYTSNLELAKELIAQILMVTDDVSEIPKERGWAQKRFLVILNMFLVRHENFSTFLLAEDLQQHLFDYTHERDAAYRNWTKDAYAEFGLDGEGEPLETKAIDEVLDLSDHSTQEDECLDLAKHIVAIIKDPKTPTALYNAMVDEFGFLGTKHLKETVNSAEFIAKQLCEEMDKKK